MVLAGIPPRDRWLVSLSMVGVCPIQGRWCLWSTDTRSLLATLTKTQPGKPRAAKLRGLVSSAFSEGSEDRRAAEGKRNLIKPFPRSMQ